MCVKGELVFEDEAMFELTEYNARNFLLFFSNKIHQLCLLPRTLLLKIRIFLR